MTRGAITLFRYRGIPIRAHWSLPLVALMMGGLRLAPGAWLGWLLVVMLHEMGHAFWALHYRMEVQEILLHGLGGHCRYVGAPSPRQRAVVAWGGVIAQGLLFAIVWPLSALVPARDTFVADLYDVLLGRNLSVALFNLIPIPPLDGAEAWALFPALYRRWRHRRGPPPPSRTRFDRETPFDAEVESERLLDEIRRDRLRRR